MLAAKNTRQVTTWFDGERSLSGCLREREQRALIGFSRDTSQLGKRCCAFTQQALRETIGWERGGRRKKREDTAGDVPGTCAGRAANVGRARAVVAGREARSARRKGKGQVAVSPRVAAPTRARRRSRTSWVSTFTHVRLVHPPIRRLLLLSELMKASSLYLPPRTSGHYSLPMPCSSSAALRNE